MTEPLDTLRGRLADLDRELLRLVSQRQVVAAEIGRYKQKVGLRVRDFAQERAVLERARNLADEVGISPPLAERLLLELIRGSLALQERNHMRGRSERRIAGRALIIGGAGRMGKWFAEFLGSQGYGIDIVDPAGPIEATGHYKSLSEPDLRQHEIIIVATPLRASVEILEQLADRPVSGLLFDIGSLKRPLRSPLLRLADKGVSVTSVHPMFGPDTETLSGRHVIFVDVGVPEATKAARELFSNTTVTQVEMNLDDHDRMIAYVLGLSHAVNIAFFTALTESGEKVPRLSELSSTTFEAQLDVAARVAGENPNLYFEIQALNEFGDASLASLANAVDSIRAAVREGDEASFVSLIEKGREYLLGRSRD